MIGGLIRAYKQDQARYGWRLTGYMWMLRLMKRSTGFTVFMVMRLLEVRPDPAPNANPTADPTPHRIQDPAYIWGFLSRQQLEHFSKNAECELDPEFLRVALAKGDACFGAIFCGRVLAAYSWYSLHPTRAEDGLQMKCGKGYVYMYKAFTHPWHRGRRLCGFGVTQAAIEYLQCGLKGVVCYVQPQNQASLRSLRRLGFEEIRTLSYFRGCKFVFRLSAKFAEVSDLVFPTN